MELRRSISGTTVILWERSSLDAFLEASERGLRDERDFVLLWRSRSLSLSFSRSLSFDLGLVRSRSGSFLRRRDDSDGLDMVVGGVLYTVYRPAVWEAEVGVVGAVG